MTLKIYQTLPATDFVSEGELECTHCCMKNRDCTVWMASHGTFCTNMDIGRPFEEDVVYKEIQR